MAWFLFIDESGHDRRASPYEVLAGIAIQDRDLWNLVVALHHAETENFGRRYSHGRSELKGSKLLKRKVFQHAALNVSVDDGDIAALSRAALDHGADAGIRELKALALAKISYVHAVLEACARHHCRAFASIVDVDAEPTTLEGFRKDYAFLFERFFYFLEDRPGTEQGIIVFDELDRSKSHLLISQAHHYFKESAIGRLRASLIIPEPLFVLSELTTGIQLADLMAYIISWGFRLSAMSRPARSELRPFADQVASLRYRTVRERGGNPAFTIWSFAHLTDLRTRIEREIDTS